MINSNGRLFIKYNYSDKPTEFEFYNIANISGINFNTIDSSPIKNKAGELIGYSNKDKQSVDLTLRTYFTGNSELKYVIDNNIPIDIQLHYGTCNNPNSFFEYETVIQINNCMLNDYSLSNLLSLTPGETSVIEESVKITALNLNIINKPKLYDLKLGVTFPIIKLVKVDDFYVGIGFESISGGSDNNLKFIYSTDSGWESVSIYANLGGNVNPYHFDLIVKDYIAYILIRDVAAFNYLQMIDLKKLSPLFDQAYNLGTIYTSNNLITTMQIVDDYIWFGTYDGLVFRINRKTYLQENAYGNFSTHIINSFVYNNRLYFSCEDGYIIEYDLTFNTFLYYRIETYDYENIYIINDVLYLTTNNKIFYSLDFSTLIEINQSFTAIKALKFIDKNIGYILDGTSIYKTLNAGITWERIPTNYNLIGMTNNKTDIIVYGTSEELSAFKANSTINNYNQNGYGNLMV